jgi:uncharacterized repeat protein (TIGR03803 family)
MTPVKPFFCAIRLLRPLAILILVCNVPAWGQQEKALYSFRFNSSDGFGPAAGLVSDNSGNLYGTTTSGGSQDFGTIFELSPPSNQGAHWTETILFSFAGGGNGWSPSYGPLVFDKSGNLYGTTGSGGNADCLSGCGTVFELSPPAKQGGNWSHSVLFRFSPPGGGFPLAGVILDESGNLYGTTPVDGPAGLGTVFKLVRPSVLGGAWSEDVIYSFSAASQGAWPEGGVIFGKNHELYGTTQGGGPFGLGVVFELTPPSTPEAPWAETTLYNFSEGVYGSGLEAGVVLDSQGNLYGTRAQGGTSNIGTVFQLVPPSVEGIPWTEVTLHTFQSSDGAFPYDAPVLDHAGNLYGTTYEGGTQNLGTVFELTPPAVRGGEWTFAVLHDFTGGGEGIAEGAFPWGPVLLGSGGVLYGTTTEGGAGACQSDIYYGCGTVFKVTR